MEQDEVMQTLREVIEETECYRAWIVSTPHLVELVERAVEAEREACAKVCDAEEETANEETWYQCAKELAKQIRARGNK